MRITRVLIPALALALVLAACGSDSSETKSESTTTSAASATTVASASGTTVKVGQTKLGAVLVNAEGRTLYTLSTESATNITCTGQCANKWPPLLLPAGQTPTAGPGVSGSLTIATRPDGLKQAAVDNHPLYIVAGDSQAGDTNGEGVGGVWHVVKASASATPTTAASSSGSGGGFSSVGSSVDDSNSRSGSNTGSGMSGGY